MADLGRRIRNEQFRIVLELDTAPDAGTTPQVRIDRQGVAVLALDDMVVLAGTDDLVWVYDYTTGVAATIGLHQIQTSVVLLGKTRYGYDNYTLSVANDDTNSAKLDTKPTAAEIDTQLSLGHGPGSWEPAGLGTGARTITFNIKDDISSENIEGVKVSVHNNDNDTTPLAGPVYTDASGNTAEFLLDNSPVGEPYKIRLSKPGYIDGETKDATVTTDATIPYTVTTVVQPAATDPELNLLTMSVDDISGVTQSSEITISLESKDKLTKDENGNFITNASADLVYNGTTFKWQILAVRNVWVEVSSAAVWGLDENLDPIKHKFKVPDTDTSDIWDLIRSQTS